MANSILNQSYGSPQPMVQQVLNFAKTYKGDPQQEVMQLLKQGHVTQDQLNSAITMARQIEQLIPRG